MVGGGRCGGPSGRHAAPAAAGTDNKIDNGADERMPPIMSDLRYQFCSITLWA